LSSNLSFLDNALIFIFFGVVLYIGLFVAKQKESTSNQYFLAGKNLGWFSIGVSLFATNISSEHLVGLAGAGSIHGFSVGHFEWFAVVILLALGWVFAPIFLRANVNTVPQFFGKRFDDRSRIYLSTVSIFAYVFTKIGVTLLAGGLVLKGVLGWDMFTSAILLVLMTGLYTVIGGMNAVVYTQIFQSIILVAGALLLSTFGLIEIGGFSGLTEKLPSDYFKILKPLTDPNLPWTGIMLGAPILGIWYWCSDQYMVQRILSAKGLKDARKGTVFAALLKIFPIFLLIFPGLIAAILYPDFKGDSAFSLLLSGSLLPIGIKGIVIAGFFAALMSSLSSSFNSAASLLALDLFNFFRPKATDHEIVLVGRLSTMLFVIAAIAIIPLTKMIDSSIYIRLQALHAYIAPPIVSVFLLGIFWKRASSQGAIWALVIGGLIGFSKIIISSINISHYDTFTFIKQFNDINYLHFAVLLFSISTAVIVLFSLFAKEKIDSKNEYSDIVIEGEHVSLSTSIEKFNKTKLSINKQKSEIIH